MLNEFVWNMFGQTSHHGWCPGGFIRRNGVSFLIWKHRWNGYGTRAVIAMPFSDEGAKGDLKRRFEEGDMSVVLRKFPDFADPKLCEIFTVTDLTSVVQLT